MQNAIFQDVMAALVGLLVPLVFAIEWRQRKAQQFMEFMNQQWWDSKQRCCICGHWGTTHDVKRHAELEAQIQRWNERTER